MNIPHVLDFVTGKTVTEYGVNEAAGVDEFVARMDQHGARRPASPVADCTRVMWDRISPAIAT